MGYIKSWLIGWVLCVALRGLEGMSDVGSVRYN